MPCYPSRARYRLVPTGRLPSACRLGVLRPDSICERTRSSHFQMTGRSLPCRPPWVKATVYGGKWWERASAQSFLVSCFEFGPASRLARASPDDEPLPDGFKGALADASRVPAATFNACASSKVSPTALRISVFGPTNRPTVPCRQVRS